MNEPLADKLWFEHEADNALLARKYINADKGFTDSQSVLDGAMAIMIERISSDTELLNKLYKHLQSHAQFSVRVVKGSEGTARRLADLPLAGKTGRSSLLH